MERFKYFNFLKTGMLTLEGFLCLLLFIIGVYFAHKRFYGSYKGDGKK